ncbi:MAG: hypothetical protein LC650_04935 [Actinobacteria bacterium]|nr:hypothetical protein [Actinomycetota bacterium]
MRENVLELTLQRLYDGGFIGENDPIIDDLVFRAKQGEERYGVPLTTHNGRDALIDCYEELLDALVYSVQYEAERDREVGYLSGFVVDALTAVADALLDTRGNGFLSKHTTQPAPEGGHNDD